MRKYRNKMILVVIIMMVCSVCYMQIESKHQQEDKEPTIKQHMENVDLSEYDSLMIVAHPDDETIWGGAHLLKDNYVVVCITNGDNEIRSEEFMKVMQQVNAKAIMLNYPDKTDGKRNDWQSCEAMIKAEINYILGLKDWKLIATHNPDGEYGHEHHKKVNRMVNEAVEQASLENKLMYFAKYVKKKNLTSYLKDNQEVSMLSKEELKAKESLLSNYSSQNKVVHNLAHMFPYENWISYRAWYNY